MVKFLNRAMSESKYLGPRMELRPTFPNVSTCGCAHEPLASPAAERTTPFVVWNQYPGTFGSPERRPALIEPTTSGRHGPVSLEGWQDLRPGVKGNPLEKFVVPFSSQPPMSKSPRRPTLLPNILPVPNGSWYTWVKMKTWLR